MPADTKQDTLHVYLNGSDITSRFGISSCSGMRCVAARLGPAEGLRAGKKVLQAEGKSAANVSISARLLMAATTVASAQAMSVATSSSSGAPSTHDPDQTTTLNLSAIGGTNFGAASNNPRGYTAIGATGVTAGSAFEPHYAWNTSVFWASQVRGILQEDADGD